MMVGQISSASRLQDNRAATTVICEQTARIVAERYGSALRAIVLTGSLARDEGSFVKEGSRWKSLGDADFFLVFRDGTPLPSTFAVDSVGHEIRNVLEANGIAAAVGLAPVPGSYFQKLPQHIATYELRSCGRVVWGEKTIISMVPAFEPSQISLEDGWRMLGNRIIELLEAIAAAPEPLAVTSHDAQYCLIKLYLDMATSYLVFSGRYSPTYRQREQTLRELSENGTAEVDAPFPLRAFADRVSACTTLKLDGHSLTNTPEEWLNDAVLYARLLWNWELASLTGEAGQISESDLMFAWMRRQPVKSRLRGWGSVLRRCGWLRTLLQWPRWMRFGWRASPRYWVYHVAAELFFCLPDALKGDLNEGDLKKCEDRLPLSGDLGAAGWRSLARMTALNYRRLLEKTTA